MIKKIKNIAKLKKLKILTTEKDFYRIPTKLRKNINFLKIDLKKVAVFFSKLYTDIIGDLLPAKENLTKINQF